MEGVFGYNEDTILRNRKPLLIVEVEIINPIEYQDEYCRANFNVGDLKEVLIYADGGADLNLGRVGVAGGFIEVSAPLNNYKGCTRPVRVLKVLANYPYSQSIRWALDNLNSIYNLGV